MYRLFREPVHRKRVFSLIELLIVVAILAILIALLLPALNKAREKAFAIQCVNNMKNIGTALSPGFTRWRHVFPEKKIKTGNT